MMMMGVLCRLVSILNRGFRISSSTLGEQTSVFHRIAIWPAAVICVTIHTYIHIYIYI